MPPQAVRILADDLTGALDAAAPFATAAKPVALILDPSHPPRRPSLTISSESRGLEVGAARAAVAAAFVALAAGSATGPLLWFKKVDSVLRGHPAAETAQMMASGGFARCIFAPAFPAMGRITRQGRHLLRAETQGGWLPAAVTDLQAAFAAQGIAAAPEANSEGRPVILIDAETQSDLNAAAARWRGTPNLLWVGSRGLAEALAGVVCSVSHPPLALVIVGTNHPVTRRQITCAPRLAPAPAQGLILPDANNPLLIDPVPVTRDGAATRAALHRILPRLHLAAPGKTCLLVTGGDTLADVLARTRAGWVECLGEVQPGLPLGRIHGGQLDGELVLTKSGGFGSDDLIASLLLPAADSGSVSRHD